MRCVYGNPARGTKTLITSNSLPLKAGTVIREETVFFQDLSPEMEEQTCQFLRANIYSVSGGWKLLYAAIGPDKLIVEVELLEDTTYHWEQRPNGTLYVYEIR